MSPWRVGIALSARLVALRIGCLYQVGGITLEITRLSKTDAGLIGNFIVGGFIALFWCGGTSSR